MPTFSHSIIPANGSRFNVAQSGEGEVALVFLHYFGGSSRSWDEVAARLPDFRCVAPDLRGFGDSDAPENGYSVDDGADDIAALIEMLGVGRFVLVGHSMGGKIALALAARRPVGLERLVLLAPSPPTPEPMSDEERARLLIGFGDRAAAEETVRLITSRAISPAIRGRIIEDNLRSSPQAWRAWLHSGSRENMGSRLSRIEVPALVLAGQCDEGMTPDLLRREVVGRLSRAQERVVAGAGHLLPLETPEEVARACASSA